MKREIHIFVISALVTIAHGQERAFAQQPKDGCSQIKYSEPRNNTNRYRLDRIEGQAVYGAASEKGEFFSASGLCVALFSKRGKQLVATVATDNQGQFQFTSVAPGDYVLIASLSALHEIIIPFELINIAAARPVKPRRLLLRMRSKEDRRKSFVTLVTEPALREELLKRAEQDQAIRNDLIKSGMDHPDKAIEARMAVIDSDNMARMKEIVKKYGWPGPELVGRDGADAAFLIVQHAPAFAFQKDMLRFVRAAFRDGKLSAWNYALLLDRVLVREGKPQVYGMSVNHWNGREPALDPIEDEANVNKRRASIGLPPLSEYLEFMKKMYFPQSKDKQ
jgi:hypothetical protein